MTEAQAQPSTLKNFGELEEGDRILGPDGQPVTVTRAYDAHVPQRMYELELEDGTVVQASGNHLWYIEPSEDRLAHSDRLKRARRLLKGHKDWHEEALFVATAQEPYEIGLEDLMNFFDFIEDYNERYYLLLRVAESIGHVAEEETSYQDFFTGEQTNPSFEKVYDARRFYQQLLSLTGERKYRKRWPVILGRVVTTDTLFHRYPDADIPQPKS